MIATGSQAFSTIGTPSPEQRPHGLFHHEELEELEEHEDLEDNEPPPGKIIAKSDSTRIENQAKSLADLARQGFHRFHPLFDPPSCSSCPSWWFSGPSGSPASLAFVPT